MRNSDLGEGEERETDWFFDLGRGLFLLLINYGPLSH